MKKKRPSPKQFEARLIQLLRRLFEKLNLRVKDHLKVGELPLEIDVVVVSSKPEWIPDSTKFPKLSEVKNIMLNIREKTLKNILSVVEGKKMAAALGEKRLISLLNEKKAISTAGRKKLVSALGAKGVISALGEERVISALGDKKMVAALLKNKQLLRSLLTQLDAKQLRDVLAKKDRN